MRAGTSSARTPHIPVPPYKPLFRLSSGLNVCNGRHSVRVAEANELRRPGALEIFHDPLGELGVPALGADELAGEVAHAGERVARVVVQGDVLAEEEGV